jgi:cobalt/nickel transport system permease protein
VLFLTLGDIPFTFIFKKVLVVAPFALLIGIFNPLLDANQVSIAGFRVSAGWVSLLSILIRFVLSISSALLLIATTSFPGICMALQRLGLPAIFTSQLLFLYRYIFVLTEEAMRVVRAREMRSFGKQGKDIRSFSSIVGSLLARTIERAEKIYQAMLSRGFTGSMHSVREASFGRTDALFLAATAVFLYLFRMHDMTGIIESLALRAF